MPEQIVSAYEAEGYACYYRMYEEKQDSGQIGFVQADHPDGNYAYFFIFESNEAAAAYKRESYHPVTTLFFSSIFGDPSWYRWEVYGSIVAQYDDPDLAEPLYSLVHGN